ncbi:MAG: hypothetical protein WCK93_07575 [Nitrosomonadales bacterium]
MKIKKITATNPPGRILLALRAGRMETVQLIAKFSFTHSWLSQMISDGLIEKNEDGFLHITAVGRAACPNRRDAEFEPAYTSKRNASGSSYQQGASA